MEFMQFQRIFLKLILYGFYKNYIYIYIYIYICLCGLAVRVPGYKIQRSGFNSLHYQIF
jgi:hypothetical protein